jgi:hypothetical protein
MLEVYNEGNVRILWNQSATFHMERKWLGENWLNMDIMTSYGVLGIEDAQAKAKWWIEQLEIEAEEQRDVE